MHGVQSRYATFTRLGPDDRRLDRLTDDAFGEGHGQRNAILPIARDGFEQPLGSCHEVATLRFLSIGIP